MHSLQLAKCKNPPVTLSFRFYVDVINCDLIKIEAGHVSWTDPFIFNQAALI